MLQSLSTRLNSLNDPRRIGETITAELRSLIDYHNCRVHLMADDGTTMYPVAFRGTLSEYQGETFDALLLQVGEGITGKAAELGESVYTPDAERCEFAVQIPGTPEIDESILCVPLRYADRTIGTVTISKLGLDQFDHDDLRVLETLAATAAAAFENARLYQEERESARTSRALLELSQALTRVHDTDGVLAEALAAIPRMLGCPTAGVWMRDPDSGEWHLAAHGGFDVATSERLSGHVVDQGVSRSFMVSAEQPFVLTSDLIDRAPAALRIRAEPHSLLVAPMRWEPDGFGAFAVFSPDAEWTFSERDLRLAGGIADITSLAIGNAERFVELERAYVSTIEALANALEAKDEYTSDHARALAEMAIAVGEDMGIEGDRLKRLELGALFHDIGKIGVPSEVIRKPAPLNAAERRLMNLHPEIGEEILAPVPFLQPIRPIVRACHERWDGGGYPDGLHRDNIPLEARIIFVCDAFHAMTSDRSYRRALPEEEALRRLQEAAGTQFDPNVVQVFVELHAKGRVRRPTVAG
jgi:HD-GYP domain-containing protein (c-di-GMP phosphodiesterase class II)